VFSLGLVFFFQVRRSRLLVGYQKRPKTLARQVRAMVSSLLISGAASPLLLDSGARSEFFEASQKLDALFPVVMLVSLLGAALMIGLSVEERKR